MNGTIRDAKSGVRIPKAVVTTNEAETRTNDAGQFEIEEADAEAIVTAHALGYYSATVLVKTGDPVNIGLYPVEA